MLWTRTVQITSCSSSFAAENWTIKSDSAWCKIAVEDARGSNTGVNERQVFFYVDPYDTESDTTHHTRRAKITITDTETGHIQTVDVVQSNR